MNLALWRQSAEDAFGNGFTEGDIAHVWLGLASLA